MSLGFRHFHKRKSRRNEQHAWVHAVDQLIYVVGIAGPLFTLDQIYKIWSTHEASGVSALTWGAYFTFNIVWITYGVIHKERVIILTYTLWLIFNGLVALGAILYG